MSAKKEKVANKADLDQRLEQVMALAEGNEADRFDRAAHLLRECLADFPDDLKAHYYLLWVLDQLVMRERRSPSDEYLYMVDLLQSRTEGVKPASPLDLPQKARAWALMAKARLLANTGRLNHARTGLDLIDEAITYRDESFMHFWRRKIETSVQVAQALELSRKGDETGFAMLYHLAAEDLDHSRLDVLHGGGERTPILSFALESSEFHSWTASLDTSPEKPSLLADVDCSLPSERAELDKTLRLVCGQKNFAVLNHLANDDWREGRRGLMAILLQRGADPNACYDYDGRQPMHWLAALGDSAAIEFLSAHGGEINARDDNDGTPLHCAARQRRPVAIRALCTLGADATARGENGFTPLHEAAYSADYETVEALIAGGAEIEAADDAKRTPLQMAAVSGNASSIAALLSAGADPEARGGEGSAIEKARRHGNDAIVELLTNGGQAPRSVEDETVQIRVGE